MIRKWKKFPFSWLIPVLFFAALWLLGTTGIYNDSNQYIAMHIHREPLYSFFLWMTDTAVQTMTAPDFSRCCQKSRQEKWLWCCRKTFLGWDEIPR